MTDPDGDSTVSGDLGGSLRTVAPDVAGNEDHLRKALVRRRLLGAPAIKLGRFTVLGQIGSGATSVVYAAYDGALDRRVAIKVLRAPVAASLGDQRLRCEAQAMARLSHPNVAAVHEIGSWDGRMFIAMEFIKGQTLEACLRTGTRAWKEIVAGNHDWGFVHDPLKARAMFAGAHYLEDAEVTIDGVRFYGSPWQPAFNSWAFNLPHGAALAAVWDRIPRGLDVLITHGPPEGFGDRAMTAQRAGCADLRARVAEVAPRLHLFGHIHQDGGAWNEGATTFANVTTWECERAATVFEVTPGSITPIAVPPHGRRDDLTG